MADYSIFEDDALFKAGGRRARPKVYRIDLSLSPKERYKKLAIDYKDRLQCLHDLALDLMHDILPLSWNLRYIFAIARVLLRRVYYKQETQELKGISEASDVPLYLLVAFNVLLDALMGCSSGGIRCSPDGKASTPTRILHYRTLDWAMDPLRLLVVQLDYVNEAKGPVIARSVTYAGYVGVLTGVRPELSISLNYRCVLNDSSKWAIFKLRLHQVAVVLGVRPSLPSILRKTLFDESKSYEQTVKQVQSASTTIAYLILSNGQHISVLEKDHGPSIRHDSDDFLAVTNHDIAQEGDSSCASAPNYNEENLDLDLDSKRPRNAAGIMDGLAVGESVQRRQAMVKKVSQCKTVSRSKRFSTLPREAEVIEWLEDWPITNEMTHYGVVMDPVTGNILYSSVWLEPAARIRK